MRTTHRGFKLNEPWHSRGYLPHFEGESIPQFVTIRLAGSLPKNILETYRTKLDQGVISEIQFHELVDTYLDRGTGRSDIGISKVAEIIEENLRRFDGVKYFLHAWVLMPNHGHVLLTPLNRFTLSSIMHSMKSYTANRANEALGRSGSFWSKEYFDRYIRDARHFAKAVEYIHNNPVKAGLCSEAHEWPYGSARFMSAN